MLVASKGVEMSFLIYISAGEKRDIGERPDYDEALQCCINMVLEEDSSVTEEDIRKELLFDRFLTYETTGFYDYLVNGISAGFFQRQLPLVSL